MIRSILPCALLLASTSLGHADEWDTLREDQRLHNGLLVVTIGAHISETCPTIEARSVAATAYMFGLARHAMSLGYSRSDIERYVDDDAERERYAELARRYFAQEGVYSDDDVEGACRVGQLEIENETTVGRFLR